MNCFKIFIFNIVYMISQRVLGCVSVCVCVGACVCMWVCDGTPPNETGSAEHKVLWILPHFSSKAHIDSKEY